MLPFPHHPLDPHLYLPLTALHYLLFPHFCNHLSGDHLDSPPDLPVFFNYIPDYADQLLLSSALPVSADDTSLVIFLVGLHSLELFEAEDDCVKRLLAGCWEKVAKEVSR